MPPYCSTVAEISLCRGRFGEMAIEQIAPRPNAGLNRLPLINGEFRRFVFICWLDLYRDSYARADSHTLFFYLFISVSAVKCDAFG